MSFLDIDLILSEEDRLPCIFRVDAFDLGHLDPSNHSSVLPMNSRLELPLWLALTLSKNNMVQMESPKHFGQRMRDELASSSAVNLREFSHYFYDVGLKFCATTADEDLKRTLRVAFCGDRFHTLLVHSLTR